MAFRAAERLVKYLERRVGPSLRFVAHYSQGSEDFEILYVREDIDAKFGPSDYERHFDTFRRDSHLGNLQQGEVSLGQHHCSIRIYDEALLFNFTYGGRANTIVSMDPEVGRDLLGFVNDSLKKLHETEQSRPEAPDWITD